MTDPTVGEQAQETGQAQKQAISARQAQSAAMVHSSSMSTGARWLSLVFSIAIILVIGFALNGVLHIKPDYRTLADVKGNFSYMSCQDKAPDTSDDDALKRFKVCTEYVEPLVQQGISSGSIEALWFLRARIRDLETSAHNNAVWARDRFVYLTWFVLGLVGVAGFVTLIVLPLFAGPGRAGWWTDLAWSKMLFGGAALILAFMTSFGYAKQHSTNFQLELSLRPLRDVIEAQLIRANSRIWQIAKLSGDAQVKAKDELEKELSESLAEDNKAFLAAVTEFAGSYGSSFVLPVIPPGG